MFFNCFSNNPFTGAADTSLKENLEIAEKPYLSFIK